MTRFKPFLPGNPLPSLFSTSQAAPQWLHPHYQVSKRLRIRLLDTRNHSSSCRRRHPTHNSFYSQRENGALGDARRALEGAIPSCGFQRQHQPRHRLYGKKQQLSTYTNVNDRSSFTKTVQLCTYSIINLKGCTQTLIPTVPITAPLCQLMRRTQPSPIRPGSLCRHVTVAPKWFQDY